MGDGLLGPAGLLPPVEVMIWGVLSPGLVGGV